MQEHFEQISASLRQDNQITISTILTTKKQNETSPISIIIDVCQIWLKPRHCRLPRVKPNKAKKQHRGILICKRKNCDFYFLLFKNRIKNENNEGNSGGWNKYL